MKTFLFLEGDTFSKGASERVKFWGVEITSYGKMTSPRLVEASLTNRSTCQDYNHPEDHVSVRCDTEIPIETPCLDGDVWITSIFNKISGPLPKSWDGFLNESNSKKTVKIIHNTFCLPYPLEKLMTIISLLLLIFLGFHNLSQFLRLVTIQGYSWLPGQEGKLDWQDAQPMKKAERDDAHKHPKENTIDLRSGKKQHEHS